MDDMQMEIDILKENLKSREKAEIVDALKGKYPLPLLLNGLNCQKQLLLSGNCPQKTGQEF